MEISWIASGIIAPMLTDRPWLDHIHIWETNILLEVKLDRSFKQRVALEDEDGSVYIFTVYTLGSHPSVKVWKVRTESYKMFWTTSGSSIQGPQH